MITEYLQMTIALAAVLGIILALGIFMKKKQAKPGIFQVVSYQSFGPRKGIAALKVGREVYVIGITAADFKLFKVYEEHELESGSLHEMGSTLRKVKGLKEQMNEHK